ncbi:MAG: nuclear transport factor 2 family protein [Rhodospirillaceae bacterium]|nr:nuclear transport factor 2 family protein [Rhodospirillaceae bacterium]
MRYLAVALAAVLAASAVHAEDAAKEKAKAEIWAKEQAIYNERATGGLSYYVNNASPHYVGWPPSAPKPLALTGLRTDAQRMTGLNKEKLTMQLMDFTLHGDTAVIYYLNHRTMRPDGTPTDEKFENIHVWVRAGNDWQIVGAMSRLEPKRAAQ